jgi:hypothetical protein
MICCKNFCNCHNVLPAQQLKRKEQSKEDLVKIKIVLEMESFN